MEVRFPCKISTKSACRSCTSDTLPKTVCSQQSYVLITKGLSFPNLIEPLGTGFISLGSPLLLSCYWSKGGIRALAMISAVNRRSSNNKENINNKANANVIFALLKCGLWRFLLGDSLVVQWLGLGDFTARVWIQSLVRELGSHQPFGMAKKAFWKRYKNHILKTQWHTHTNKIKYSNMLVLSY